jgi:uncharacterized protein YaiE (UPF0345 family)
MLAVNEYFDGKVKSISFNTGTLPATVGVMVSGAYTFNTADKEAVTIVSGSMDIQLPGNEDWNHFSAGDTFHVPANSAFNLKIFEDTAYLCVYG